MRLHVVTAGDEPSFPATLGTVNSVLQFHPEAHVWVMCRPAARPTPAQCALLAVSNQVHIRDHGTRDQPWLDGRPSADGIHACADAVEGGDVVAWIAAGCVLCAPITDMAHRCRESGTFATDSVDAATVLIASTDSLRGAELDWPDRGATGQRLERLDRRVWCPHDDHWRSVVDFRDGQFVNVSEGQRQRMFSPGAPPFWARSHRERLFDDHALQTYPYVWFLAMLWFGRCTDWSVDPYEYLPPSSRHLFDDLIVFLPQIVQVLPRARHAWNALTPSMIARALDGVPRMMSLTGSMRDVLALVALHPWIRRYVEIGSYEGGSILTLALRFMVRDIEFYAVESFTGNLDGTADGAPLPSRRRFIEHVSRFPGLRVRLVPGDSVLAATLFDDDSLDCVFIDGCHETAAVLRDIDAWLPKLRRPGIIAGDDYNWDSVFDAVHMRFPTVNITQGGVIWWTLLA